MPEKQPVICPWCGKEMRYFPFCAALHYWGAFKCECGAYSPTGECADTAEQAEENAYAAAMMNPNMQMIRPQESVEKRDVDLVRYMTDAERLKLISEVLYDYDGYRIAQGLADLIDEIRGYAGTESKESIRNRPLTLEELHNLNPYTLLWIEHRHLDDCGVRPVGYYSQEKGPCGDDITVFIGYAALTDTLYNKDTEIPSSWRCWLHYPSKEERDSAKWGE